MNKLFKFNLVIVFALAICFSMIASGVQAENESMPGFVAGTSNHFEINNSQYLNIAIDSSELISAVITSVPNTIIINVEAASSATSTDLTLNHLIPLTTYYKYQDGYHNLQLFTSDASGSYSYTQDLSVPRLIFIQTHHSTKFINSSGGDCSSIGNWNLDTQTCTLTIDLNEAIQIDSNGITLDGAGHSMIGMGTGNAIFLSGRNNVSIKNLHISNFSYPVYMEYSSQNQISFNAFDSNGGSGVFLANSYQNTINNNISQSNAGSGFWLFASNNNELFENTASLNGFAGAGMYESSGNIFFRNNFISNAVQMKVIGNTNNSFNSGYPNGGNYWSDFDSTSEGCNDSDDNGICDSSYNFPGGSDNLPWTKENGWLPPLRNPVIIVPGIMGSYLNRVTNNEEIWPKIDSMLFPGSDNYLNDLILSETGQKIDTLDMNPSDIIENVLTETFYENLISTFIDNGYILNEDLFLMPYDWRLDVRDNLNLISSTMSDALDHSSTGKVDIVAHSLGAVFVKTYLGELNNTSGIGKVIFAGIPQVGAPKAFKALNHGDNMDFKFGLYDILNPERVKIITQNMPSVYQLLPSREYFSLNGGYIKDFRNGVDILNYDETVDFMLENSNDSRNQLLLESADNFHQDLDQRIINADIYNIIGCDDWTTIGGINIYGGDKAELETTNGDGTVPLISSVFNSNTFNNYYTNNSNHLGLVVNQAPLDLIRNLIINGSNEMPSGISQSSSVCFNGGSPKIKRYSTHSPVELHLYDAADNHVGLNSNGDIDLEIPGSKYEVINHNTFIFVPDGNYRVEIKATDLGSFDFKVKEIEGGEITETISYLNIPIDNESLKAELDFGADENSPLQIDTDGDGDIDSNIESSATLSGNQNLDVIPPTTTASLSGAVGSNNWYISNVSLELIAEDNNGGVGIFNTEYSYDNGIIWNTYNSVLDVSSEGTHTIIYRSRDLAGNLEGEKSIDIKLDKTPPEAKVHFDPDNRYFKIDGVDNISQTITTKVNDQNYTVTDEAGHTLKINLVSVYLPPYITAGNVATVSGASLDVIIKSIKYDSNPAITLPFNNLHYEWTNILLNGTSKLKTLQQSLTILGKIILNSTYDSVTNKTIINKTENTTNITQILNGMILLNLKTDKGKLGFEY